MYRLLSSYLLAMSLKLDLVFAVDVAGEYSPQSWAIPWTGFGLSTVRTSSPDDDLFRSVSALGLNVAHIIFYYENLETVMNEVGLSNIEEINKKYYYWRHCFH